METVEPGERADIFQHLAVGARGISTACHCPSRATWALPHAFIERAGEPVGLGDQRHLVGKRHLGDGIVAAIEMVVGRGGQAARRRIRLLMSAMGPTVSAARFSAASLSSLGMGIGHRHRRGLLLQAEAGALSELARFMRPSSNTSASEKSAFP